MSEKEKMNTQNKKEISGFLKGVEIIGNKLPHPAMLFLLLAVIVVIISHFVAAQGVSVTYFDARAKAEVTKKAVSLLTPDGLRYMFNSATKNFTGFAPLGTVLVAMLGVGVAEWTGLFNTSLKKLLMNANPKFLTPIVLFAGIMSNIASDAGYSHWRLDLCHGRTASAGRDGSRFCRRIGRLFCKPSHRHDGSPPDRHYQPSPQGSGN